MWSQHMSISTRVQNVRSIRPIQCSSLVKYLMMKDLRRVAESSLACEAEELFTLAEKWALRLLCWHQPALHSFLNQPDLQIIGGGGVVRMKIGSLGIRLVVQIHVPKLPHAFHKILTTNKCTVGTQSIQLESLGYRCVVVSNAGCEFKGICLKWLVTSSYLDIVLGYNCR